jgi:hypothetical protein
MAARGKGDPGLTLEAKPNVVDVLAVVAPADRRKRLEIADVFAAYAAACKARGAEVASVDLFGSQAKAFTEAAGIRVLASGGKLMVWRQVLWKCLDIGPTRRFSATHRVGPSQPSDAWGDQWPRLTKL